LAGPAGGRGSCCKATARPAQAGRAADAIAEWAWSCGTGKTAWPVVPPRGFTASQPASSNRMAISNQVNAGFPKELQTLQNAVFREKKAGSWQLLVIDRPTRAQSLGACRSSKVLHNLHIQGRSYPGSSSCVKPGDAVQVFPPPCLTSRGRPRKRERASNAATSRDREGAVTSCGSAISQHASDVG
jgi:hypothetical protein